MAFTENLADFINPDTPGYVSAMILGEPVDALFDKSFQSLFDANGSNPVLYIDEANKGSAVKGSPVVIASVDYKIGNFEPDGHGLLKIVLEQV